MTLNEFYKQLKKAKKELTFYRDGNSLRAVNASNKFCPLTAVWYVKEGEIYDIANYGEAAKDMGIGSVMAEDIADAADHSIDTLKEYVMTNKDMKKVWKKCLVIREKMEKILLT